MERDKRGTSRFSRMRERQQALAHARWRARVDSEAPAPSINAGESDFRTARVPYGVDLAAAWAWRFIVIVIAGFLIAKALGFLMVVVMPVVVALFITALVIPVVDLFTEWLPRSLASIFVVFGVIAVIALMITFATQQVIDGADDLAKQVVQGLDEIERWLKDGPLEISEKQLDDAIGGLQDLVSQSQTQVVDRVQDVGTIIGHVVAGFFIVLFSTFFFLAQGSSIWAWMVRLFPRAARERANTSGQVAWASLTQFVRATVLVAGVDALGIALVAAILDLPFVAAIGVLVFLGSFVPLVGATVSGMVAILVALVDQGPVVALVMLGGVIAVQQIEAHVLQPFLMGRFVSIHPLGVILAIAVGVIVAGIPGALIAVPLAATVNAVAMHLGEGVAQEPTQEEFPVGDVPEEG
ncbi:MAG TPA: AI-2E family transporter [Nocardioidaceae bacterium]|nr:AI-2E family transporter [Nocardioidaceae bacterium]